MAGDHLQQLDNGSSSIISKDGNESFTAEEEILYQTQYSEGYDLHDPKYISWVRINHPDENCEGFSTLMKCFQDASIPEEIPVSLCADTTVLKVTISWQDLLVHMIQFYLVQLLVVKMVVVV